MIPLSALRERLDGRAGDSQFTTGLPGLDERVLLQTAGTAVTWSLALAAPATFTARAALVPHEWRDGTGSVSMVVSCIVDGTVQELWRGVVGAASENGEREGYRLSCPLPADASALVLETWIQRSVDGHSVGRAIWAAPALSGSGEVLAPDTAAAAPPTSTDRRPGSGPRISVLTPVHDPPLEMLREAVESVRGQSYPDWELCLIDDGSRDAEIIAALDAYAAQDARIVLARHERAGGISRATNTGLERATGEYVALLDHDDYLEPDALARVAAAIADDPGIDMLYSDEDIVMHGQAIWVHRKPGWSPDTLRTNGYTCHLGVYRAALVREIGGFRPEFDGSQDVDMILRLTERTDRVAHLPHVLYHWRMHAQSTAGGDAKPYAYVAAQRAITGHLERIGVPARVDFGPPGLYRVVHRVDPDEPVTLVLAVQDVSGLYPAARTWGRQDHPSWTLTLAAPAALHPACVDTLELAGVDLGRVQLVAVDAAWSRARALALAAERATGNQLVLMQEPVAGVSGDWLSRLIGYAGQTGISAAGPVVLAPDGRVAHAGVALPDGVPLFLIRGRRTSMDDFFGFGTSVHNVRALSGLLATGREQLQALGGLDPAHGELQLIDYCLRAGAAGGRIVTVPDARVALTVADAPVNDIAAISALRGPYRGEDPFYGLGFRPDRGDFAAAAGS